MTTIHRFKIRNMSLKTRLALAFTLFFILSSLMLTWLSISTFEKTLKKVVVDRQVSLVENTSNEIDQKIELRRQTLIRVASDLGSVKNNGPELQAFLEQHRSLDGLFDNIAVFNTQGLMIANLDQPYAVGKLNISKRDYFQSVITTHRVMISSPLKSGVSGRPLVVMCLPVFDNRGQMVSVLLGVIELTQDSFLADLSSASIGHTGYFYVVTTKGVFVTHPDQSRILKNTQDYANDSLSLDTIINGLKGSADPMSSSSAGAIFSYQRLKSVDWIVTAVSPTAEAFSQIGDIKNKALFINVCLIFILLPMAWWFVYRQLAPLQRLHDKVANIDALPASTFVAQNYSSDEVGELNKAFDHTMLKRLAAESSLTNSENRLRIIADNMSAFIGYVDYNEKYIFANKHIENLYGIPAEDAIGKTINVIMDADFYKRNKPYVTQVLNGEWTQFERRAERKGKLEWDRVTYVPDINKKGQVDGFFVLAENITDFKRIQSELMASEKRIRTITDNVPALIAYIDADERYQFCNRVYKKIPGVDTKEMIGKSIQEVFGDQTYRELEEQIHLALKGEATSFERMLSVRGINKYMQYEFVPDTNLDGATVGFYSMAVDVSDRKEAELRLQSSEGLLRTVADNIPAFVSFINSENRFQFVNRPYEAWFNIALSDIKGSPVPSLLSGPMRDQHQVNFNLTIAGEKTEFECEICIAGTLGHYKAIYVPQFDEQGHVVGINSLINDITDAKVVENQLHALARFDSLTGLPNRNQLNERLEQANARSMRTRHLMAAMFLDIDRFKSINDTLGHHAGDLVLKEFAKRLQGCIRQTDMVGRLAGDEFVIVLEGLNNKDETEIVATKIILAMTTPFNIDGHARIITTSIGIAISNGKKFSSEQLLNKADEALYLAKKDGRNNFKHLEL